MAKTKILTIRLTETDYKKLDNFAKEQNISKAKFVIDAINTANKNNDNNELPKKDISIAKTYALRLNENEAKAFQEQANKLGETRSRLLRQLVRELINHPYPDLLYDEQCTLRVTIRYLSGISRNFNQITAAINTGKLSHRSIDHAYLTELKKHVDAVKDEFLKYLEITHKRLLVTK